MLPCNMYVNILMLRYQSCWTNTNNRVWAMLTSGKHSILSLPLLGRIIPQALYCNYIVSFLTKTSNGILLASTYCISISLPHFMITELKPVQICVVYLIVVNKSKTSVLHIMADLYGRTSTRTMHFVLQRIIADRVQVMLIYFVNND